MKKLYDPEESIKVRNILEEKLTVKCGFYRSKDGFELLMHPRHGIATITVSRYLTWLSYLKWALFSSLEYKWYFHVALYDGQKLFYSCEVGSYNYNKAIDKIVAKIVVALQK